MILVLPGEQKNFVANGLKQVSIFLSYWISRGTMMNFRIHSIQSYVMALSIIVQTKIFDVYDQQLFMQLKQFDFKLD